MRTAQYLQTAFVFVRWPGSRLIAFLVACLFLLLTTYAGVPAKALTNAPDQGPPGIDENLFNTLKRLWSGSLPIKAFVIKDVSLYAGPLSLEHVSCAFEVTPSGDVWEIHVREGLIEKVLFSRQPHGSYAELENVGFGATFKWHRTKGLADLSIATLDIPGVGKLDCKGFFPPAGEGGWAFIEASQLQLGHVLARCLGLPPGFSLSCPVNLKLSLDCPRADRWTWEGNLDPKGAKFQDASFQYAGEGLSFSTKLHGVIDPTRSIAVVDIAFNLNEGEILWDKLYLNFAESPLDVRLEGSLLDRFNKLDLKALSIGMDPFLNLKINGAVNDLSRFSELDLHLSSESQSLEPFSQKFLKETFAERHPFLQSLKLAGQWGFEGLLKGSLHSPEILGRLEIDRAFLDNPEQNIHIGRMHIDLPVWLRLNQESPQAGTHSPTRGIIELQEIRSPLMDLHSLALPLEAFPNGWRLTDSFSLPFGNDRIEISEAMLRNVLSTRRTGRLMIQTDGLNLNNVLKFLFGTELPARMSTESWGLELSGDRVTNVGAVQVDAFSGCIRIERFNVDHPFSPGRIYSADVSWTNIDMEELTRLTQFGKITGRLKGDLKNLEISYGAPVAFDLVLESAPVKGVPQRISLTALDNLTQLGSGESVFKGMAGLITVFFKRFSYQKIGIRCILENDFFTIRGLSRDDGMEYLVKRGSMGGVNIVNRHPNNRISWNDMVRRLQRIKRTSDDSS